MFQYALLQHIKYILGVLNTFSVKFKTKLALFSRPGFHQKWVKRGEI